jgi:hypothetical protein
MTDPFFKNLELQIKETGAAFWACRLCQSFAATFGAKVNAKLKEVEEKVVGLQEKVETHTEEIQQNKEKLVSVEKKVEKMERNMEDMEQQSEEGLLEELRAREAIKRNLVMYGLNEPHHSIKDGKDRMEADKEECEKVFRAMGSKARRSDIRFCRRLGEKGEDDRPLLLGMTSETIKSEVLDHAKGLQNTDYQDIGVAPDQTKKQKQAEIRLAEEVKRKNRDELTEQDVAKNLKWALIGQRGEKRIVKVQEREREEAGGGPPTRGTRGRGRGTWSRGRGKRARQDEQMDDDMERPRTRTKQ